MNLRKINIIFLTFFIAFSFLVANFVYAQNEPKSGINLSISPTFLNLKVNPGEEIKSSFKVRNNNNFTEELKLRVIKFKTDANGKRVISEINDKDEFIKWIKFEENSFKLTPSASKTVNFTIKTPKTASLGYYYGILTGRLNENKNEGAVISGATVIPVLLEVKVPNAKKEIQITSFKATKLFYEYLPVTFNVSVKNTGNVHSSPVGDIFIDSMFNKDVSSMPVNEARGNVLPGEERVFSINWDEGFAVRVRKEEDNIPIKNSKGEYEYKTKYDFSKANEFRFGRYTAHLLMVYDNGERDIPIESTVSFWVIPWKIVGGILLIIVLAFAGLFTVVKGIIKKLQSR